MQFQGTRYSQVQKENDICYVKLKQFKFAVNMHVDNYSDYFLLLSECHIIMKKMEVTAS